jgi:hypothetical protein
VRFSKPAIKLGNRPVLRQLRRPIGAAFFFDAVDLGQAHDPHGGYVEPFAGHMKRLLPKFWAFLGYLQKEQGALVTMAGNLHLFWLPPLKAKSYQNILYQVDYGAAGAGQKQKGPPSYVKRDHPTWKGASTRVQKKNILPTRTNRVQCSLPLRKRRPAGVNGEFGLPRCRSIES